MRSPGWEIFEGCAEAVVVTDARGWVRYLNDAATRLLHCGREPRGRFCWEVVGLRSPDGTTFCGPDCPVQRHARSGRLPVRRWVVHAPRDADPMDVELYTVLLPAQHGDRRGVMHMIAPADPIVRPGGAHRPARDPVLREGRDSEVASAGGDCR